jgi:DeoR family fructose operon transcriptional repressor
MRYKERYRDIVAILQHRGRALVSELSGELGVSEVTIRKDLDELEHLGLCRRFHSGAAAIDGRELEIPVKQKKTENSAAKEKIARSAASLIGENSAVIIDAGSTAHQIARFCHGRRQLRVVTNSLLVGAELADEPGVELLMTGGSLRHESQALVGPFALSALGKVHVDIAFVGAMGVCAARGCTSATINEALGKEAMLKAAATKVIVADHSKLERVSFAPFAHIREIDLLITDDGADEASIARLREAGLEVMCADM